MHLKCSAAIRIRNHGSGNLAMDCDDDGETHAGSRLAHLLDIIDAPNHLVVVRYAHSLGIDAPHTHFWERG